MLKQRAHRWSALSALNAALLAAAVASATAAPAVDATSDAGRALIRAASMEPVDIALTATSFSHGTEHVPQFRSQANLRVVFRIAAAYTTEAHDYPLPEAKGWLTIRFWSRTFDPVRPDEDFDLFSCPESQFAPCQRPEPEAGRVAARRRGGEYPVWARIEDRIGTEAHRWYSLAYAAGLAGAEGLRGARREPCDAIWDNALGVVVSRPPKGAPALGTCNFTPYHAFRNGRPSAPAAFLKLESDGTPRFSVSCPDYPTATGVSGRPRTCRMVGFHGPWPLVLYVDSDRAAEWAETLDRLRDFLARHTVPRTD